MNLTSRNQDPMHASLALSSLLSVWYKPNSLNNKSIYNTLLLELYICAKPRLTYWYPRPEKSAITFAQGCTFWSGVGGGNRPRPATRTYRSVNRTFSLSRRHGLYSISGRTSNCKISWSLGVTRFVFRLFQSLWNLTSPSAAALPRCLSNFRTVR